MIDNRQVKDQCSQPKTDSVNFNEPLTLLLLLSTGATGKGNTITCLFHVWPNICSWYLTVNHSCHALFFVFYFEILSCLPLVPHGPLIMCTPVSRCLCCPWLLSPVFLRPRLAFLGPCEFIATVHVQVLVLGFFFVFFYFMLMCMFSHTLPSQALNCKSLYCNLSKELKTLIVAKRQLGKICQLSNKIHMHALFAYVSDLNQPF